MTVFFIDGFGVVHCMPWESGRRWIDVEDEIYLVWGASCVILDVTPITSD